MKKEEKIDLIQSSVVGNFALIDDPDVDSVSASVYQEFSTQIKITEIANLVKEILIKKKLIVSQKEIRDETTRLIESKYTNESWDICYHDLEIRFQIIQDACPGVSEGFIRGVFKTLATFQGFDLPKKPRKAKKTSWKHILVREIKNNPEISDEDLILEVLPSVKGIENSEYYVKEFAWMLREMIK